MSFHRRKGVAIVESSKGILVVAGRNRKFTLPGGGANKGETRLKAAIRELKEETGLGTKSIKYLFDYRGNKWKSKSGKEIRNIGKVFLVKSIGIARPRHEIKYVNYYKPAKKLNITHGTKKIIEMYMEMKKNNEL